MSMILPHWTRGPAGGTPIVFLHGFAGDHETWIGQQIALETRFRTIAFDLPGHGAALEWPRIGNAGVSADAVIGSLAGLGIERFHLVGHSMGGAAATLISAKLAESRRLASLTLVAPGGFGREINHRLLRRFAAATDAHEIHALLEQFFGFEKPVPLAAAKRMEEARRDPRVGAALVHVAEAILDGERQKSFDLARLAELPHPVRLIWGDQDRVLPLRQTRNVPGVVAVHIFEGVGHMPHLEVARDVSRLVAESANAS